VLSLQTSDEREAWITQLRKRYRFFNFANMATVTPWLGGD
jgi:hypothetical protein